MVAPKIEFSSLHSADGSATYSSGGYTVIASVNGPIEVQRRDELPEDAFIEVNVRPASGVGMIQERYLETIIASALREVISTRDYPRSMIQITLQVIASPEVAPVRAYRANPSSTLLLMPSLLQSALLALLAAGTPLKTIYTSTVAADAETTGVVFPEKATDLSSAASLHFLAFTANGGLLVSESEGDFDFEQYEQVCQAAKALCVDSFSSASADVEDMEVDTTTLRHQLESAMQRKIEQEQAWRLR